MVKITQQGFNFLYVDKKPGIEPIKEEWSIERVAAFLYFVDYQRMQSMKYTKGRTWTNKFGNLSYVFDTMDGFDDVSYKEITKIIKTLPNYLTATDFDILWLQSDLKPALDWLEDKIKEMIKKEEAPVQVFGKTITPKSFHVRPTEAEYEVITEERTKSVAVKN